MTKNRSDDLTIVRGSDNIFADLDVHMDVKDELKVAIAVQITRLIQQRGLTQHQVAALLRTDQAKVSNITRGRLAGFSVDRLVNFLVALGIDVDVRLKPSGNDHGKVTVSAPIAAAC